MDSLTQLVLGAAVGESILGKKVGNKAPLWGAVAGTIPDLDIFVAGLFDVVTELSIHRGFSHSLVFSLLAAPLLASLIRRIHKKRSATWWQWTQLSFWAFLTHSILDCFTTWGTQLFWPLTERIAFQSIFVIDPLYTLSLLMCILMVLFLDRKSSLRRKVNFIGLSFSSIYLLSTVINKQVINFKFEKELQRQNIDYHQMETRPAPFSTILWSANVETENNFLLAYYSYFDEPNSMEFTPIPKNHQLLYPYRNNPKVEKLLEITEGFYTVTKSKEGVIVNDLRFGMSEGWNASGDFVFRYEIKQNQAGETEIEKINMDYKDAEGIVESWWSRVKGE